MAIFKKLLFEGNSDFNGKVKVTDQFGIRRVVASDFTQSRSLDKHGRSEVYWDSFGDLTTEISPKAEILILGLGAGTNASTLRKRFPDAKITGVEIDPMMISIGKEFFDLYKTKVEIIVVNAKDFVEKTKNKYDLIYLDAFVGGVAPSFSSDPIFFKKLQILLRKEGQIIVNSIYHKKADADNYEAFFKQHFDLKDKIFSSKSYRIGNLIMKGINYS